MASLHRALVFFFLLLSLSTCSAAVDEVSTSVVSSPSTVILTCDSSKSKRYDPKVSRPLSGEPFPCSLISYFVVYRYIYLSIYLSVVLEDQGAILA